LPISTGAWAALTSELGDLGSGPPAQRLHDGAPIISDVRTKAPGRSKARKSESNMGLPAARFMPTPVNAYPWKRH
jgi:hypothetical protein